VIAAVIIVSGLSNKLAVFDNIFSLNQLNADAFVTLPQQYWDICSVSINTIAGLNGTIDIVDLQGNLLKRLSPNWGTYYPSSISRRGTIFHCSRATAPYYNWLVDKDGNILNMYTALDGNLSATRESCYGSQIFYGIYPNYQIAVAPDRFTSGYSAIANISPQRPRGTLYYCNTLCYHEYDYMKFYVLHRNAFPNIAIIKNVYIPNTINGLDVMR